MIISDTAVKNRVSVVILAIIIVFFGAYCYNILPRESYPDVTIPYVFVSTNYKGVSASDIETSITVPIEKKLKGLDGVKKVSSVSSEGSSQINIEFQAGTDIDEVLQKVKDKVDEAQGDLPTDRHHGRIGGLVPPRRRARRSGQRHPGNGQEGPKAGGKDLYLHPRNPYQQNPCRRVDGSHGERSHR